MDVEAEPSSEDEGCGEVKVLGSGGTIATCFLGLRFSLASLDGFGCGGFLFSNREFWNTMERRKLHQLICFFRSQAQ